MSKKITKPTEPIHDERCGDCFYNLQSVCKRNPETCPYNQPPYVEEDLYQELCSNCPSAKKCHEECTYCDEYIKRSEEQCQ